MDPLEQFALLHSSARGSISPTSVRSAVSQDGSSIPAQGVGLQCDSVQNAPVWIEVLDASAQMRHLNGALSVPGPSAHPTPVVPAPVVPPVVPAVPGIGADASSLKILVQLFESQFMATKSLLDRLVPPK